MTLPTLKTDHSNISYQEILDFWFGQLDSDGNVTDDRSWWWQKNPELDRKIRTRYEPLIQAIVAGELTAWEETPASRLALIIALDQFTRNSYRDTPQAFATDPLALRQTLAGLAQGQDQQLPFIQRVFFYMPLEHAEDPAWQQKSVALFTQLAAENPDMAHYVGFAEQHKAIIDRFGRFPHRNEILGRETTPEEAEFLTQPGSSF